MKKILFSLAALAALSLVAIGCKNAIDSANVENKENLGGGGITSSVAANQTTSSADATSSPTETPANGGETSKDEWNAVSTASYP